MDDEEEIPVKYRLSGETEWTVKNQAVMTLAKTKWAIRLKLCKQGDAHQYYSLHVVLLTPDHVARVQIKCQREGQEKPDWLQKYTFGGTQTVLVNPCLMAVDHKEKITFSVELRLMWDKEEPFQLGKEIQFPNGTHTFKVDDKKLMVDPEYIKRRVPLLGYLFEDSKAEKKEYTFDDVAFEDLVDVFGAFQHHWPFPADRLLQLIPIARRLGVDLWGQSLSREFTELLYRNEPIKIVPLEDEAPENFEFDEPLTWTIDDASTLTSSTSGPNQNVFLTSPSGDRNCIIYVYTQEIGGQQYLSLGFQMSRPSTSQPPPADDDDDVEVDVDTDTDPVRPRGHFDIHVALVAESGEKVITDVIRRISDEDYLVVGSPVFAKLEDVMKYRNGEDKLTIEFSWVENSEEPDGGEYAMPGIQNGEVMCEGTLVKLNKQFLSHHSAYFRGLFSDRFKESAMEVLTLPSENLEVFVNTLELMYNRRLLLGDVQISRILDFSDRKCISSVTTGMERMLWGADMHVEDKKWLAEQFLLPDLKMKCSLEFAEEILEIARAGRKRCRPASFEDEPPVAPPQPEYVEPIVVEEPPQMSS